MEGCIEFKLPLHIHFVHYQKAFDSISHNSMWEILRCYGLPVVKNLYKISVFAVNISFTLSSCVRQGCLLSLLLFAIIVDWIMRTSNKENDTSRLTI